MAPAAINDAPKLKVMTATSSKSLKKYNKGPDISPWKKGTLNTAYKPRLNNIMKLVYNPNEIIPPTTHKTKQTFKHPPVISPWSIYGMGLNIPQPKQKGNFEWLQTEDTSEISANRMVLAKDFQRLILVSDIPKELFNDRAGTINYILNNEIRISNKRLQHKDKWKILRDINLEDIIPKEIWIFVSWNKLPIFRNWVFWEYDKRLKQPIKNFKKRGIRCVETQKELTREKGMPFVNEAELKKGELKKRRSLVAKKVLDTWMNWELKHFSSNVRPWDLLTTNIWYQEIVAEVVKLFPVRVSSMRRSLDNNKKLKLSVKDSKHLFWAIDLVPIKAELPKHKKDALLHKVKEYLVTAGYTNKTWSGKYAKTFPLSTFIHWEWKTRHIHIEDESIEWHSEALARAHYWKKRDLNEKEIKRLQAWETFKSRWLSKSDHVVIAENPAYRNLFKEAWVINRKNRKALLSRRFR